MCPIKIKQNISQTTYRVSTVTSPPALNSRAGGRSCDGPVPGDLVGDKASMVSQLGESGWARLSHNVLATGTLWPVGPALH